MFILRVHSVDTEHPLPLDNDTSSAFSPILSLSTPNPIPNNYSERRGIVHLFRPDSHSSLPTLNPTSRSTSLFVVAVPNYLSADDFFRFCRPHSDHLSHLLYLRFAGLID